MPNFGYKVRDKQGRESQGTQEASSEEELIGVLQRQGLLVISVAPAMQETIEKNLNVRRRLHPWVTIDDRIVFTRQLSTMLEAGVTLLKCLEVLTRQIESRHLLTAVEEVKRQISAGSTFHDALAKHPKIFSQFWLHVVETGEASGTLPAALSQLADYLESSAAMRRKVTSALIYPAVLIFIAGVALVVFTVWIIPIFARIFENFDVQMPLITQVVITFSKIVRSYFLYLLVGLAVFGYLLYSYVKTKSGRWQLDRLKLKLPILASLFQKIALERFASGLATLIESGVPILYGLDIVGKAVENKVVEAAIAEVRESVRQGKGMSRPMEKSAIFTPMVVQMVSVGEEIGELAKMLRKVSEFYREHIATSLTRITTLIEPAILVFMGVVVGILVISMFLPIFQLATISQAG